MKGLLFTGCILSILPWVASASSPVSAGVTAHAAVIAKPVSTIGIKYNSPYNLTYSDLIRGERIGVNCPTDRQCLLVRLRHHGLELKEKDGGTLTPEHRAQLQAELNSINARFR
jgi:hypothetical protein